MLYLFVYFFNTDIVQMHIETLDAVHRESRRLPPIQKVTNSYFYLPLDKGLAEPQSALPTPLSTNSYISQCHSRYVCLRETACDSQHTRAVHAGWLLCFFDQMIAFSGEGCCLSCSGYTKNIYNFNKDLRVGHNTSLLCERTFTKDLHWMCCGLSSVSAVSAIYTGCVTAVWLLTRH